MAPVLTGGQATGRASRLAAWLRGSEAGPYAGILIRGLTMSGREDLHVIMYLGRYTKLCLPSRLPRELAALAAFAANIGAVTVLLPGTEDAFLQPDVMAGVRDCGVKGLVCYSPEYEMARTHRLRSAAFSADLFCVGGSNGLLDWGRNSVSEEVHGALASALLRSGRG